MPNICLIGNSHAGCFLRGWNAISKSYPGVSIKFYAFAGQYFDELSVNRADKLLETETEKIRMKFENMSGNRGAINLKDIDLCLIVGAAHWWGGIDRRIYSEQVADAAVCGFFEKTKGYGLIKKIREISEAPIFMTHIPFRSSRNGGAAKSANSYKVEVRKINETLLSNLDAELLEQPEISYKGVLQSKLKFAVGYRRARAPRHVPRETLAIMDDLWHMNTAFGAIFLKNIFEKMGEYPIERSSNMPEPDGHLSLEVKERVSSVPLAPW